MGTLIRFFENGVCITVIYIYMFDALRETLNWLDSHDIGYIYFIICGFRLFLRNKYGRYMHIYGINDRINYPVDEIIDIGKTKDLIVKVTNMSKKRQLLDTPRALKYRLNL